MHHAPRPPRCERGPEGADRPAPRATAGRPRRGSRRPPRTLLRSDMGAAIHASALRPIRSGDEDPSSARAFPVVPSSVASVLVASYLLQSPHDLSLIHISEPTRQAEISYAVFCLKKKK